MFGRYLGYYTFGDLLAYANPGDDWERGIGKFLPEGAAHFFGSGREALFAALNHRRKLSRKIRVAIPAWGCPVVLATVRRAGFVPLLMDVSPRNLHMDVRRVAYVARELEIDSVVLVAENGIPYSVDEIQVLKDAGLVAIADYAIAWQNIDAGATSISDFEIFSGGFSKPVAGMGLGVLTTREPIDALDARTGRLPMGWAQILFHLMLQSPLTYRHLYRLLPQSPETEFDGRVRRANASSVAVVARSLARVDAARAAWEQLQRKMRDLLAQRGSGSPLVICGEWLQTKVVLERAMLREPLTRAIEIHRQYPYDLLSDPRAKHDRSGFPGLCALRRDYLSVALNLVAIHRKESFLSAFEDALVVPSRLELG